MAYSRALGPPPIHLETGFHTHLPPLHVQHHFTVAAPRFQVEPLHPALPLEWIAVVPFAMIVVAYLSVQRARRFLRAQHPL